MQDRQVTYREIEASLAFAWL